MRERRVTNGFVHHVMVCDQEGCTFESEPQKTERQLRLIDFHVAGWFIAMHYGDCCPGCKIKGRHHGIAPMPWSWMVFPLEDFIKDWGVDWNDPAVIVPQHTGYQQIPRVPRQSMI